MKKASPLGTLATIFPNEVAAALAMTFPKENSAKIENEAKTCYLPGCKNKREGNKLYCCKEHNWKHQKGERP